MRLLVKVLDFILAVFGLVRKAKYEQLFVNNVVIPVEEWDIVESWATVMYGSVDEWVVVLNRAAEVDEILGDIEEPQPLMLETTSGYEWGLLFLEEPTQ